MGIKPKDPLEGVARLERQADGTFRAAAKKVTKKDLIKERLKESLGEGWEEYSQDVFSGFGEGYNKSAYEQYIDAKYNSDPGSANTAFEYSIGEALASGLSESAEKAVAFESIKDGIYGNLSTIMGGPNFNLSRGAYSNNKDLQGNWFERLSAKSPVTIRGAWTPLFNSTETKLRQSYNDRVTETLNQYLDNKEVQDMIMNAGGTFNFMQQYQDALEGNDEYAARSAKFGQLFSVVNMLNKMKGTAYYDMMTASLDRREALGEMTDEQIKEALQDSNSDASLALREYKTQLDNKSESKEETMDISPTEDNVNLVKRIAKNAKDFKQTMKDAEQQKEQVEKDFGGEVDDDGVEALVFQQLAIKNMEKRMEQIDKELA